MADNKPTTSNVNSSNAKEHVNSEKDFHPNEYEDYGYFFYPERFGKTFIIPWYEKAFTISGSRDNIRKAQCEENVKKALENHPGVKVLSDALKNVGCEPNLLRHFSCEHCDAAVKGGFDPVTSQTIVCCNSGGVYSSETVASTMVTSLLHAYDYCRGNYDSKDLKHLACTEIVLCYNNTYNYEDCSNILLHELIHAYDFCRANVDFTNKKHVACTEIRAANLTGCSLWESLRYNTTTYYRFRNSHKDCVRYKAALSLQMVRNISEKQAYDIIDSVYDKCINDLEPFGRRVRSYEDYQRAFAERNNFSKK